MKSLHSGISRVQDHLAYNHIKWHVVGRMLCLIEQIVYVDIEIGIVKDEMRKCIR